MKLHESGPAGMNLFTAYDSQFLAVNQKKYEKNLIVLPQSLIEDWTASPANALGEDDFAHLLALDCQILLLGTGARLVFPPTDQLRRFSAAGIGLEVMDAGAACRTYNILASEGRRVAAAIVLG